MEYQEGYLPDGNKWDVLPLILQFFRYMEKLGRSKGMSLCCIDCFQDKYLRDNIKEEGERGVCDFCSSKSDYCIEVDALLDFFEPLFKLYEPVENFMPLELLKDYTDEFIYDKIDYDWEIFSEAGCNHRKEIIEEMLSGLDHDDDLRVLLDSYVAIPNLDWYEGTSEKLEKAWGEFCKELTKINRYFPQKTLDLDLLKDILSVIVSKRVEVGHIYYRARISDTGEKLEPSGMGKPSVDNAQEGRANPRGIPYLYLASDEKTAIAEKRPQLKDRVTVGRFVVKAPLSVIDLRDPKIESPFAHEWNLKFVIEYIGFVRKLGEELSKPVDPRGTGLEYIPLQYLCELIKTQGYDGVLYKSAAGGDCNLALFNDDKVDCVETQLRIVEKIEYESSGK
jgi:hypothetical protein